MKNSTDELLDEIELNIGLLHGYKVGDKLCLQLGQFPEAKKSTKSLIKKEKLALLLEVEKIINNKYELSITDLELKQHQQAVEIPVLSKTELLAELSRLKEQI